MLENFFRNSSIKTKLRFGFGLLLAVIVIFGVYLVVVLSTVQNSMLEVGERFVNLSVASSPGMAAESREVTTILRKNEQLLDTVQVSFALLVVILSGIALAFSMAVTRSMTDSLENVLSSARDIAAGNWSRRTKTDAKDEIGDLAAQFNVMANAMEEKVGQIKRREKRLLQQNKELEKVKSRLEKAVRHLSKLDKVRAEFVSVAAHQLRTPLTGIKWALLSLVREGVRNDERQITMIHKASHAAAYMLDLVNNLLNVARIDEGKIKLALENFPLLPLLQEAVSRFWILAESKGVKLETANLVNSNDPRVIVDKQRVRVVLDNLLDNAIKYTPKGGQVKIGMQVEGDKAVVYVSDNGMGIPPDGMDRVFSKFYRAENAKDQFPSGNGLGLFLSRKIVQEHGGEMWFKTRYGKGTTFYFSLPLAAERVVSKAG